MSSKSSVFHSRNMDVGKIKKILDRPATNVNAVNAYGRTPLHIAAMMDSRECIERLLDHRQKGILRFVVPRIKSEAEMIDLNMKDQNGDTPLALAVKKDSSEAVNLILSKLKSTSIELTFEQWKEISSYCLSSKMQQMLEKHFETTTEIEGGLTLCNMSKDKIILKLPQTFKRLLSLLIDKLLATFPSPILFFSKLPGSNILFNKLKLKEDKNKENMSNSTRLDSGVEINFADLINDINFHKEIIVSACKRVSDTSTPIKSRNYAHEYVKDIVKRKLPLVLNINR